MASEQESEEVQRFKATREKAEQGDARAQFRLSEMYSKGEGVPPNYVEAVKWSGKARKTAEEGDAETQFKIGVMYHKMKDYDKAARWYEMAAEQGHAKTQRELGCMYANGEGVRQNYDKAAKWLWKRQDKDKSPQLVIGALYLFGSRVRKDDVEAYAWFLLSKENGDEKSFRELISSIEEDLTAEQIKKGKERAAELPRLIVAK